MERASDHGRGLARALIAAVLVVALMPSLEGSAQESEEAARAEPADAAAAAEQPLSRRERRRAAEAAAAAEAAEAAQGLPAAEVAASAAAEPVAAVADEEELICKKVQLTGTKIGKRVCGTQAEWDAYADSRATGAKDVAREIGDRSQFPAAPVVPTAIP